MENPYCFAKELFDVWVDEQRIQNLQVWQSQPMEGPKGTADCWQFKQFQQQRILEQHRLDTKEDSSSPIRRELDS